MKSKYFATLREEVNDALTREAVAPMNRNTETVTRAMNRSKDAVVALMERYAPTFFARSKTYTVAIGDKYITLPPVEHSDDSVVRRIIGLYKVLTDGTESTVGLTDRRDMGLVESESGLVMYREGENLYFLDAPTGATEALTLKLRYSAAVPDILGGASAPMQNTTYDYIPDEWTDLIVLGAIERLIPFANPARQRYREDYMERANALALSLSQTIDATPMRVRPLEDGEGFWDEW